MRNKSRGGIIIHFPTSKTKILSPCQRFLHPLFPFLANLACPFSKPYKIYIPQTLINERKKKKNFHIVWFIFFVTIFLYSIMIHTSEYTYWAKSVKEVNRTKIWANKSIGKRSISASSSIKKILLIHHSQKKQIKLNYKLIISIVFSCFSTLNYFMRVGNGFWFR